MITLTATVDQKALDRYLKRLDKNRGKPLHRRAEEVTFGAMGLMVAPLRARIPVGPPKRRAGGTERGGNARRRVRTKRLRKRGTEVIRPTWLGSSAHYFAALTGGSRAHSLAPRAAGAYTVVTASGRSFSGTRLQRSPLGTLPGPGGDVNVRPLADIHVAGVRARPWVGDVQASHHDDVVRLIARDVWDTRP